MINVQSVEPTEGGVIVGLFVPLERTSTMSSGYRYEVFVSKEMAGRIKDLLGI